MDKPILYINACARQASRTKTLAEDLLAKLGEPYEEVKLAEMTFPVVTEDYLSQREKLIEAGETDHPMFKLAGQFAGAKTIVIAAPFWDLSFPAMLKQYLEIINVVGITFKYSEDGVPVGLCAADRLYYVSTAGGHYVPEEYGYGYIKALARGYYGIADVRKIEAVGLDIVGADADAILAEAKQSINQT